jgi:hypothetical protein
MKSENLPNEGNPMKNLPGTQKTSLPLPTLPTWMWRLSVCAIEADEGAPIPSLREVLLMLRPPKRAKELAYA